MRKITRSRRHDHPAGDGCNAARGSGTGTKLRNGLFGLYSPGEQGRFFPIRMTNYEIRYDDAAREDLDRLPRRQAGQIVKKIRRLEKGMHGDIKRLQKHDIAYRLRMGDYRVLFDLVGECIVIRRIRDRKDAYD